MILHRTLIERNYYYLLLTKFSKKLGNRNYNNVKYFKIHAIPIEKLLLQYSLSHMLVDKFYNNCRNR